MEALMKTAAISAASAVALFVAAAAAQEASPKAEDKAAQATPTTSQAAEETWESTCHDKDGHAGSTKATPTPDSSKSADDQPRIALDSVVTEAGDVWQGQFAEFSFTIRNEGQSDLTVTAKGG